MYKATYSSSSLNKSAQKYIFVSISIIILNLVLCIYDVDAYVLNGARWPGQPYSGCCANVTFQIAPGMYAPNYTAWLDGSTVWNNSPAYIYYRRTTSSSGNINLRETYNSGVGWSGIATWSNSSYANAVGQLNRYYTQNYNANKIQAIAAHELGHFLGLADLATVCTGSLMSYAPGPQYDQCGYNTPQQDEVNGVNAQY